MKKISVCYFTLIFLPLLCFAQIKDHSNQKQKEQKKSTPPPIGNYALPNAQEVGPLLSFGQTIVDKNITQLYIFSLNTVGAHRESAEIDPTIAYGVSDNVTVLLTTPYAQRLRDKLFVSSGIEDSTVQMEYAFYNNSSASLQDQATVVAAVKAPTGSIEKHPQTGLGAPSYFVGATFSRLKTDWYGFTSHGIVFTSDYNSVKTGNQFIYQFGLGKNINYVTNKWLFDWLVEVDGQYTGETQVHGIPQLSSGGNIIFITPSLWFSTKTLAAQLGMGFPIVQNLYGTQTKTSYLLTGCLTWTFY